MTLWRPSQLTLMSRKLSCLRATIASLSIGEDLCGGCLRAHTDFYPEQASKYGPGLIWLLNWGARRADEYAELQELRDLFREQLEALFTQVDVILAPSMPIAAPSVDEMERGSLG